MEGLLRGPARRPGRRHDSWSVPVSTGLLRGGGGRDPRFGLPTLLRRLLEDDDVLPGEEFERLLEPEALRLDLAADLLDGHLVLGLDRDFGVLAPELDQDQPATGAEGLPQALEHGLGIG